MGPDSLRARDLMTTEVVAVPPSTPATSLARLLADRGISAAPVTDPEGRLLGVVTEADLLRRLAGTEDKPAGWLRRLFRDPDRQAAQYARTHGKEAHDVMTQDVVTVDPDATAEHCAHLARWGAAWMGFNAFPSFPEQWHPLPVGGNGETTAENMDVYMRRCYPSIPQIVAKIAEVRAHPAAKGLKDVYVMTNAKAGEAEELKAALRRMGGWDRVAMSRDLVLSKEQKYVAQAVDMLIGQRAQVLIGNGVSSRPCCSLGVWS